MASLASPIQPISTSRPRSESPGSSSGMSDDLPPPSHPRTIERMSSHPSLTHSASSAGASEHDIGTEPSMSGSELRTPVDYSAHLPSISVASDDLELLSPPGLGHDGRKSIRGGFTKSMQSLRGRAKADLDGEKRSRSEARPGPVVVIPGQPVHKPAPQSSRSATRPTPISSNSTMSKSPAMPRPTPTRSGGSFSSFIRKLTGKSSKASTPVEPVAPSAVSSRASTLRPSASRPALAIHTGSPIEPSEPSRLHRKPSLPNQLAEPVTSREAAPRTAPPQAPPQTLLVPSLVEPSAVPLPLSPLDSKTKLEEEAQTAPATDAGMTASESESSLSTSSEPHDADEMTTGPSLKLIRQVGRLRLEGLDTDGESEAEESERDDEVKPLQVSPAVTASSYAPDSASSEGSGVEKASESLPSPISILSPTSAVGTQPKQIRVVTQSPPRKSPITSPTESGLVRKGSKWRTSMMHISDNLKHENKRISKPPPSSFDAYQAHQLRLANNRKSCSPTTHTAGSIARDIQEIRDKDEREMAESMFLM